MTRSRSTGGARRIARAAGTAPPPDRPPRRPRPPHRVEPLEPRRLLAIFTVTTTADAGPGSLRQAILDANATPTDDTIAFALGGPSYRIAPRSPLPAVTGTTIIDGATEPQYFATPVVELDGAAAGDGADGLVLGGRCVVRGLVINRFSRHGVVAGAGSRVEACYIGTDAAGSSDAGNGGAGVVVTGGGVRVGGPRGAGAELALGNVISGNGGAGVWVTRGTAAPSGVTVVGNYIGTNAAGTAALGNDAEGVLVEAGTGTVVGVNSRARTGNLISGNGASGVRVEPGADLTSISGNLIGTDVTGTRALGNGTSPAAAHRDGVTADGTNVTIGGTQSPTDSERNIISANAGAGVRATNGSGGYRTVAVHRNYVGTDASGTVDLGNGSHGVWLSGMGGTGIFNPGVWGNVVSGNGGDGVRIDGSGRWLPDRSPMRVAGNYVGTTAGGGAALGNGGHGVHVLPGTGAVVIGSDDWDASRPPVAGVTLFSDDGNVISANGEAGVMIDAVPVDRPPTVLNFVTFHGNYIGTDSAGNLDLGNAGTGVSVDGARTYFGGPANARVAGNLVSGNGDDGVRFVDLRGGNDSISSNFIGTNAAGTARLGNDGDGIELRACSRVLVGTTGRNIVSANSGHGLRLTGVEPETGQTGHHIAANYIGTDAAGVAPLGNGGSGIHIDGGSRHQIGIGYALVVSGNAGNGITIMGTATGDSQLRSVVGGDVSGRAVPGMGNGGHGVAIVGSPGNAILTGSYIVSNGRSGVYVEGNAVRGTTIEPTSVYDNGRLGIDLAPAPGAEGVTPNDPQDADAGPNDLQNFPVITSALRLPGAGRDLRVRYVMNGEPSRTYRVRFYTSPEPDPSGHGEGMTALGNVQITTDATGTAAGVAEFHTAPPGADFVTATAYALVGGGPAGTSEFSPAVRATAPSGPLVVARHVFYNRSSFDGNDPAANAADDNAVAPLRWPLLPGAGPVTPLNYTNYTRGLNGLMIDVLGLPAGAEASLGPEDFTFRTARRVGGVTAWVPAPPPMSVTLRRGAGVGGTDRVTLVWEDYHPASKSPFMAVANGWLEVTVKADADTGLAEPDVFAFGNLIGEADNDGPPHVTATDLATVKRALNTAAPVTSTSDFNRDGRVNALDVAAARQNLGKSAGPPPTGAPALAGAAVSNPRSAPPTSFRAETDQGPSVLNPADRLAR